MSEQEYADYAKHRNDALDEMLLGIAMNCPYCRSDSHDEETEACPERKKDAERFAAGGAEYLFDALATEARPCGGREVTRNPVRVMLAGRKS